MGRVSSARSRVSRHRAETDEQPDRQIELLGSSRLDADRRSGHVALWRQHALPGICGAGWHEVHFGLRHRAAGAGKSLGSGRDGNFVNYSYFSDSLSLGSYSGAAVLRASLRPEESISVLQFPLEIPGARFAAAGVKLKLIHLVVERREERQPLNMIPVIMS